MSDEGTKAALLVDAREAARLLAVSPRKLWQMTHDGEVLYVRLGRCVRYPVTELQRMVDRQMKGGDDER